MSPENPDDAVPPDDPAVVTGRLPRFNGTPDPVLPVSVVYRAVRTSINWSAAVKDDLPLLSMLVIVPNTTRWAG